VSAAAVVLLAIADGGGWRELGLWLAGIGIVLATSMSISAFGSLARDLEAANHELAALAEGDLHGAATSAAAESAGAEIGALQTSIRRLRERLNTTFNEVRSSADTVGAAAHDMSRAAGELGARTERQAAALEETAASMEQITAAMKNNAAHAESSSQIAAATRAQAEKGGAIAREAIAAMSGLSASSKKIVDIVGVVDEIAFQTNLLALNAAVEAARAGDAGRGFAVVAGDVRGLAQRSATAAREIKQLIQDSNARVDSSGRLVGETGRHLDEIVDSVKRVADLIAEMSLANREQSTGIEEVSRSVMDMDSSTQQNAGMVESATAAAQAMHAEAARLAAITQRFQLTGAAGTLSPEATRTRVAPAITATAATAAKPRAAAKPAKAPATTPAKAVKSAPSVKAGKPLVERRSKNRPWANRSAASGRAPVSPPAAAPAAASRRETSEDWTEF